MRGDVRGVEGCEDVEGAGEGAGEGGGGWCGRHFGGSVWFSMSSGSGCGLCRPRARRGGGLVATWVGGIALNVCLPLAVV